MKKILIFSLLLVATYLQAETRCSPYKFYDQKGANESCPLVCKWMWNGTAWQDVGSTWDGTWEGWGQGTCLNGSCGCV